MNARIAKEFGPLLFPWCVVALTAFGPLGEHFASNPVADFLTGLAGIAFFVGCLLLATLPFGSEFQQRTWQLLLGQPLARSQLWKEKFLVATIAVVALMLVHGAIAFLMGKKVPLDDLLPVVGFTVATICSAGLGALAARSVIGGMVFSASWQFLVFGGVSGVIYLCYRGLGRDPFDHDMQTWPVIAVYVGAGAIYSALTLWLGWRAFAKLEVRDAPVSANLALPSWITPKALTTFLRCRPTGNLLNLIRKEVGLQKPIFTIAAFFIVCWVVTFLLLLLQPSRHEVYVGILNGLTGTHVAIIVLLAGCVSLGDEKALGLAAWHLTLPVSARRQWFVKLLVAAATAGLVGLVLPLALSALTLTQAKAGLAALVGGDQRNEVMVLIVMVVVGTLSWWCASLVESTVRAALFTVLSVMCIGTCLVLPAWISFRYLPYGLQCDLITSIIAHFQLPPQFFSYHEAVVPYSVALVVLSVVILALFQSLAQFRHAQVQRRVMLRYSLILGTVAFVGTFWCADLTRSIDRQTNSPLVQEVRVALYAVFLQDSELPAGQVRRVTPQELEKSIPLSNRAKRWLRNSTMDVHWTRANSRQFGNQREYTVEIQIPKRIHLGFRWNVPEEEAKQGAKGVVK